jgi:hypothetical protein
MGIDVKFHQSARIQPERIIELVGGGDVMFVPPATLRLKTTPSRADLFQGIGEILREIA